MQRWQARCWFPVVRARLKSNHVNFCVYPASLIDGEWCRQDNGLTLSCFCSVRVQFGGFLAKNTSSRSFIFHTRICVCV